MEEVEVSLLIERSVCMLDNKSENDKKGSDHLGVCLNDRVHETFGLASSAKKVD